jgi:hypothetical protein
MSALTDACAGRPFANGTERQAWEAAWCAYCVHDHDVTHRTEASGTGCSLLILVDLDNFDDGGWPEAWIPEPDDGSFSLPSRLICGMFTPCTRDSCTGDPGAADRAERVAEVTAYWRSRR